MEPTQTQAITCPHCGHAINLSDIAQKTFAQNKADYERALQEEFEAKQKIFEENTKMEMWRKAQLAAAEKQSKELATQADEVKRLKEERDKHLEEEKRLLREKAEMEAKARQAEIDNLRKLEDERIKMRRDISEQERKMADERREAEERRHKDALEERDKQMEQMKKTIAALEQQSKQGSQQIQGEIREDALKQMLMEAFPFDTIEDVATGKRGADLTQTVRGNHGEVVGTILWESKNTKHFQKEWIKKLTDDRIVAKAWVAVLVSQVLPEGIDQFGRVQDVWVCDARVAVPLAHTLREHLITIKAMERSLVGKEEKMELLYAYLGSDDFRAKIEHIVGAFTSMKDELEREKRAMQTMWSRRERELERVIANTAYLYGDVRGIMGVAAPRVEMLELPEGD